VLYVARVSGNARNALVKFDTSSLPSTTVIISAALEVYSEINLANGPDIASQIYADAILSNWNESTVTWASKPVTQSMGDPSKGYEVGWLRFDVSNIARAWFSGTIANEGIQLRLDPAFSSGGQFVALPSSNAARLVVAYHTCKQPLTGIDISGPTQGYTGTTYTFGALPAPASPTTPVTYTWRASDRSCGGSHQPACPTGPQVDYDFDTTGLKTITLTATNYGGTFVTTHQVNIITPTVACPAPIGSVVVAGGEPVPLRPPAGQSDRPDRRSGLPLHHRVHRRAGQCGQHAGLSVRDPGGL